MLPIRKGYGQTLEGDKPGFETKSSAYCYVTV